jgi:hypothetical protein
VAHPLRLAVFALAGLVLLAAVVGTALYFAAGHVPPFYRQAIQVEAAVHRQGSDRMLQRSTALASDLKRGGRWAALFTTEEINGWLAVDLVENHRGSLPRGIAAPRVAIDRGRVMLGCRYRLGFLRTVLWLEVEPYLTGPNAVAFRIHQIHAGWLPVPMQQVLASIDEAVRQADLRIEWSQSHGNPVALVSLPPHREAQNRFTLDALRLTEGKLYASGTSKSR